MNLRTPVLLLLSLIAVEASAQVNALPPTRHILVYGDAQARTIPDRFKIALNFEAIDRSPDIARKRVEENIQMVLRKLSLAHVPEGEIVATSLRIEPRQRYDSEKREQVFQGTAVTRTLTARFNKQSDLQIFLSDLRTSEELQVSAVTTELSEERELRMALRQKSIESSREKADIIAKAYGAQLGRIYSVSDVAPSFEYGIQEGNWPATYQWHAAAGGSAGSLDRITVTGSRLSSPAPESLQTGYVNFDDKIYAVFLLAD